MRTGLAFVAALSLTSMASAGAVLWDQSPDFAADPQPPAYVDQEFGDFPAFSTYLVSDVVFGSAVTITGIDTFYTNGNLGWPQNDIGTARLNIFSDPLDNVLDDPSAGTAVDVTYTTTADGIVLNASGLNIALGAGTYWIGLTPILDFGVFGQEFHQGAGTAFGAASHARNPGEGFGLGPDWFDAGATFGDPPVAGWDAAIVIYGVPTPGALALLGLAGLATRRRRG